MVSHSSRDWAPVTVTPSAATSRYSEAAGIRHATRLQKRTAVKCKGGMNHLRIFGLARERDDVLGIGKRSCQISTREPDQRPGVPHGSLHVVRLTRSDHVDEFVGAGE